MHPKLIKANIALFNGARSETRRLLDEYRAENAEEKPTPMELWLDAQSQDNHDERIARLHTLIETAGERDPYAQQAQEILDTESEYSEKPIPGARKIRRMPEIAGVAPWKAALFAVAGGGLAIVLFSLFNPGAPSAQNFFVTPPPVSGDPTLGSEALTPLPDFSTAVPPEQFQADYPAGILQIAAIEDNTQRATNIRERTLRTPITGARFYALKLIFECRAPICEEPPQARLSVELNGSEVVALDNVGIDGESLFQPIAQRSSTTGWVVFQLPLNDTPTRLIISPATNNASETPEPVFIDLTAS